MITNCKWCGFNINDNVDTCPNCCRETSYGWKKPLKDLSNEELQVEADKLLFQSGFAPNGKSLAEIKDEEEYWKEIGGNDLDLFEGEEYDY